MKENNNKPIIMIVEDEELLLQVIAKKLTLNGFETISCASAEQALEYLENIDKNPHGIWLDYHLKGMDGLHFIKRLKDNEKWADIPIIIVSNSANDATVKEVLALGANKYMLKAKYRLEEIIEVLKEVIQTKLY